MENIKSESMVCENYYRIVGGVVVLVFDIQ